MRRNASSFPAALDGLTLRNQQPIVSPLTPLLDIQPQAAVACRDLPIPPRNRFAGASTILWWLAVVIVCLFPALWPGDVPWVNDEPALISNALDANATGWLAPTGLWGSFGIAYGPLPTQMYQFALLITHDPVKLVAGRAILFMAVSAMGLAWLGRTLRLNRWFVPVVLCSPFFWIYGRLLWDNPFAIPIGILALAAYTHFLKRRAGWALVMAIGCCLSLLSIHFMTGPLVAVICGHALWTQRPALWRHRVGIGVVLLLFGVSSAGYVWRGLQVSFIYLKEQKTAGVSSPMAVATPAAGLGDVAAASLPQLPSLPSRPDKQPVWRGLLFPLKGGRLLSGHGFYAEPEPSIFRAVTAGTSIAYILVAAGIGLAFARLMHLRHTRKPWGLRDRIGGFLLCALLLQMGMDGVMRVAPYSHYYTGTAIVFILFAWLAADAIPNQPLRALLLFGYGGCLAAFTVVVALQTHRDAGMRSAFGPSLGQQISTVQECQRLRTGRIETDIPQIRDHPHALPTLRRLLDLPAPPTDGPAAIVQYQAAAGPSARLQVRRVAQ